LPIDGTYIYPDYPPNTLPGTPADCPHGAVGGSLLKCSVNFGEYSDTVPTAKVDLNWTPVAGQNFYAFFAHGYKAGGVNADPQSPSPTFKPEEVNDYEAGWKGQLLDGHIVTQTGLYYMEYINMQYPVYDIYNTTVGNGDDQNLGASRIKGIEFSAQSKFGGLNFNFSADYNKTSVGDLVALNSAALPPGTVFGTVNAPNQCPASGPVAGCFNYLPYETNVAGESIPLAPTFTANVDVSYGLPIGPGTLRPRVYYSYVGSSYSNIFQTPYYYIPSRHLLGANLDYEVGSWLFEVYGTNLTNLTYVTDSLGNDWQYGAPRQYGFRFNYGFGGGGG